MTLKVELPPTGIVRTISVPECMTYEYDFGDSWDHVITRLADPKEPEIACLKSEGPDGLEDFGGQWHFAESLKALKENPDSGKKYKLCCGRGGA